MAKGYLEENSTIGELVRKAENDFTSPVQNTKYVEFDFSEDINRIFAYLDSKHVTGDTDEQGREKPFFNISLAARNIWFRATDIDRKNVRVRPTKAQDDVGALLATAHLQDWMRREDFGTFLNSWGLNSASFNESVVKFVEKDGRLIPSVVPWNRILCDSIDFANNPKIEILEMTPAQLRKQKYDQKMVDSLCDALEARETTEGQNKDNKSNYIRLYEVHGEFPLSLITQKESDQDTYTQQMHVISFLATKEDGKFEDYTLFAGKESQDPYMLTALLPEIDGSIALKGAVKTLFDVQWMQNHTAKQIKDQLDLSSLILFQTSDPSFVGQNVLSALTNGDLLVHQPNMPVTLLNNRADTTAIQNFSTQWKALGNEIAGISDAMLGVAPKSGTAWRQTEALLQESYSLFELMTENKGLDIERMLRRFVIPFIKKKMDTKEEVVASLSAKDIMQIDSRYIKNKAVRAKNNLVVENALNGKLTREDEAMDVMATAETQARENLEAQGSVRFLKPSDIPTKTWKDTFKDLEWDLEVDITNESLDKDALATLNTLLLTVTDPVRAQGLQTKDGRMLLNKILQLTGAVSTLEMNTTPPVAPIPQPQEAPQGTEPAPAGITI